MVRTAGNYVIRYVFSAIASAVCLPAVEAIGIGWFSTISAVFLVMSAVAVMLTTLRGESWRNKIEEKHDQRQLHRKEKAKVEEKRSHTREVV